MLSGLSKLQKWGTSREKPLPTAVQVLFFHRISHLLLKGYPLLDGLKMTGWDQSLKPITNEITLSLKRGDAIDTAFRNARFSPMITNFLYFGRIHHDLPHMFKQCEDMLRIKKDYLHKLASILRYPVFLLVFIMIAFGIMKQTILPNFLVLFQDQGNNALWLMRSMNTFLNVLGFGMILCFVVFLYARITVPKFSVERKLALYKRIPALHAYHSFTISFLFTSHLHSLLKTGLPLKQSFELISQHEEYEVLSHYCHNILNHLANGKPIGYAIHECFLLRPELTEVFHQANDSDAMQNELEMLRDFFMEYVQEKLTKWLQLIQPVFFIVIAVIIISIYASIMVPLYQWMDQI